VVVAKVGVKAIGFRDFCAKIGVKLSPAQNVLTAVAYDGIEPKDLLGDERELARTLFGDVDEIPKQARAVALHLCGARGGKSYVLCAMRLLHLALTVNLDALAPGEIGVALIVAPDIRLARQTFRYVLGAARGNKGIERRLTEVSKERLVLVRENGRKVAVECLPATRGGSAVRARSLVGAALDEFAFFRNEDFKVNDGEIFRAVSPRILRGGQMLVASTAWARLGMMYDLFSENYGKPSTVLAARATTLMLNPSKDEEVARDRERDPVNAAREFDCEFMDSGAATFFSHDAIDAAVDDGLVLPLTPPAGAEVMIGADTGFRRDSSALVVVYKLHTGQYVVADIVELRPRPNHPLRPSDVVRDFADTCKRHGCTWLMADEHYRETIDEELAKHKLSYVPAPGGAEGKSECYMHAKMLLHQGKLKIPKNRRLIDQMRQIVGRPLAGGGLSISSPRTTMGGHGDILSALVLAVSQRAGQKTAELAKPKVTLEEAIKAQTAAYWAQYEEKRLSALAEQQEAEGPPEYWSIYN
jgi:hypothetical protein